MQDHASGIGEIRIAMAGVAIGLIAGCVTTAELAPPVDALMAARSSSEALDETFDVEALARGRRIYVTKCTHCHSPERITDYPAAAWPTILETMAARAKLDSRELHDLRLYVSAVGSF